jgi:hypothetical protein
MKHTLISGAALALLLTSAQSVAAQDPATQILGMWKYTNVNYREATTGKITYPYGERPAGHIVYTKGGRFVFSLVGDNRKRPEAAAATDAERLNLFNTLGAGSGIYKVEGKTIHMTYENHSHQLWTGATHKRDILIEGNRLTITSPPSKNLAGQEIVFEVILERVE